MSVLARFRNWFTGGLPLPAHSIENYFGGNCAWCGKAEEEHAVDCPLVKWRLGQK